MSLKDQIKNDIKVAMRAKDTIKRDTLRNIQTVIKQIEVDERRDVEDTDVEKILMKYAKQREDGIVQFSEAGRDDLAQKESVELAIVQNYLPEPMDDVELESVLRDVVVTVGATGMQDMGKVMGAAKASIGSRADGGRINKIVKKILT